MTSTNRIVSRDEWTRARKDLLAREKAFTREREALSAARRDLPRVKVDRPYVFQERSGTRTLADLFDGKKQLIVYQFMLGPKAEAGCRGCSFVSELFDGTLAHLAARDTALVAVSRAPVAKLEAFKERMGWKFRWLSSAECDFSYDFGTSFRPGEEASYNYASTPFKGGEDMPGLSVFLREGDDILHTYSTYARGLDPLIGTYTLLDLTPLGRQESDLPQSMAWLRHHDAYDRA